MIARALLLGCSLWLASLMPAAAQINACATQICTAQVHYLSAGTNNATVVKATPGALFTVVAVNTTAVTYYLKLYDKATAPTCGTDTPVQTYPVPATPASGTPPPLILPASVGMGFSLGIAFCLVGGLADNDNTNAATGVAINFSYR